MRSLRLLALRTTAQILMLIFSFFLPFFSFCYICTTNKFLTQHLLSIKCLHSRPFAFCILWTPAEPPTHTSQCHEAKTSLPCHGFFLQLTAGLKLFYIWASSHKVHSRDNSLSSVFYFRVLYLMPFGQKYSLPFP